MPYEMISVKGGYKIRKKDGLPMKNGRMYTSDKPMTKEKAKKQLAALYASYNNEREFKIFKFDLPSSSTSTREGGGSKVGYKIGRRDGKKLENGRYYTTNKLLTLSEAKTKLKELIKSNRYKPE